MNQETESVGEDEEKSKEDMGCQLWITRTAIIIELIVSITLKYH